MNQKQNVQTPTQKAHHRVRTFFAAILGTIALLLIFLSTLTIWLNRTLTNTNTYVSTVAPLASNPSVQKYISQKTSDEIINNVPVEDIVNQLLPGQATTQNVDTLKQLVRPIISQSVTRVVTSQQFATIWRNTNADVHKQLISQLEGSTTTNEIQINLSPVINGLLDELKKTQLGDLANQITINNDAGVVTLKDTNLTPVRNIYKQFKLFTIALAMAAFVFAGLAIIVSVHHAKTLRRVLIGTGVGTLFLAGIAWFSGRISFGGNDATEQKAISAIVHILLHNLQTISVIVGTLCIFAAIAYKLVEMQQMRSKPIAQRGAPKNAPSIVTKTRTKV